MGDHPVQFSALLLGVVVDSYGQYLGGGYTMISGSGIQRALTSESRKSQPMVGVNIEISPERLATFFPGEDGQNSPQLQLLVKGNDWQTLVYPESTAAVQGVVQQMLNCPYQRMTKLMYLQAKVLELMALQLAPVLADQDKPKQPLKLKPKTIAQIYYARNILHSRLENPPLLLELATLVGVSDVFDKPLDARRCATVLLQRSKLRERLRTLHRGFQELFGTTIIGYLTEQRLARAEQLLRAHNRTVSEVANQVGYAQLGHFAAAFRRKFGITPSECLLGKKSSRSHPPVHE